jgi:hypothetical protein
MNLHSCSRYQSALHIIYKSSGTSDKNFVYAGETRVFSAGLTIREMFEEKFKRTVQEKIQLDMDAVSRPIQLRTKNGLLHGLECVRFKSHDSTRLHLEHAMNSTYRSNLPTPGCKENLCGRHWMWATVPCFDS